QLDERRKVRTGRKGLAFVADDRVCQHELLSGASYDSVEHQQLFLRPQCTMSQRQAIPVQLLTFCFAIHTIVIAAAWKARFVQPRQKQIWYIEVANLLGTEDTHAPLIASPRHESLPLDKIGQLAHELAQRQPQGRDSGDPFGSRRIEQD